jgi:hypothetical protein
MELNLGMVPKMVGDDAKIRFNQLYRILNNSKNPLFFTGPSGSGKTIYAMNLAKKYARSNIVPAYYVQLSPDQTKTSLIMGLRLKNGSLVPVRGLIAEAMRKGGIVVVDEATHTTQELLLMFNSICDRTTVTSIGDDIVFAKDTFRVIFTANTSHYAGNIKLPQSFAQRLMAFHFDYPSYDDELRIMRKIVNDEYGEDIEYHKSVFRYIVNVFREVRNEHYPLSVRNMAAAAIMVNLHKKDHDFNMDDFLDGLGQQAESTVKSVYQKIWGKQPTSTQQVSEDVYTTEFLHFVGSIGRENFRNSILSAGMFYLDFDGMDYEIRKVKDKLLGALL